MSADRYTVVLYRDGDGVYNVEVPALPGCLTFGDSLPEALHNAEEAIRGYIASLEKHDEPVPADVPRAEVDFAEADGVLIYKVHVEREALAA
jgi:antitoxin HicB